MKCRCGYDSERHGAFLGCVCLPNEEVHIKIIQQIGCYWFEDRDVADCAYELTKRIDRAIEKAILRKEQEK